MTGQDDIRPDVVQAARKLLSRGNRKLPRTTAILNLTSATDCPSRKLGLCKVADEACKRRASGEAAHDCYALKSEVAYPAVLPYRRRQDALTREATAGELAAAVLSLASGSRYPVNYLRVSEAGDFRSQDDVDKMERTAILLKRHGIGTYCYTARADLDYSSCEALTVNGSGFRPNGGGGNMFAAVAEPTATAGPICCGDCTTCHICAKRHGRTVQVRLH